MNVVQRVQDIILKPKETWPAIEQETADTASIYRSYVILLAAIPAIAGFIGLSIIGAGAFGISVRVPLLSGLGHMVVSYVLSLVAVFLLALIVDALAPTFGGSKSQIAALKLVAYGSTAAFLGGIFSLLPSLGVLGLVAALYSIYLIYTGLPVLMKCPQQKAGVYTAVVIGCGIVAMVILGALTSALLPTRGGLLGGVMGDSGSVTIKTPGGEVNIDTSKMEQAARKMEEAGKRLEAAQKAGDSAAANKAMGDVVGAVAGGTATNATPIAVQDLKMLLPESLGDLKRESFETQGSQAMGVASASAKATYALGEQRVQLSITDLGGLGGLASLAGWANMTVDRETPDMIEKVYKQGSRTMREQFRKDGSHGEITVILDNGVIVETQGDKVDMASMKKLIASVDLNRIEALKRAAKP
jgi:hypothetical protein